MGYQVAAPLVLARDKEGKVHERYQGAVIDWLPDDQAAHFLEAGLVVKAGVSAPSDAEPESVVEGDDKPGPDAHKPELVDWIAANVAKADGSDYTKTELRRLDPADLRDIVDSVE